MKLLELLLEYTSYEDMLKRLKGVYALVLRGSTEGERSSAQAAYDRLLAAIKREYGDKKALIADATIKGMAGKADNASKTRTKPQEPPRQKTSSKTGSSYKSSSNTNKTGRGYVYHDPRTNWTFYVLRYTDPNAGKRGSDKVWGIATKDNNQFASFWGAHGHAVRWKNLPSYNEANALLNSKLKKGYKMTNAGDNPAEYAYIFNQFR